MDINPYQPPQADILVSSDIANADVIRKAHINHEASIKSVGTLYYLGGVLCIGIVLSNFLGRDTEELTAVVIGIGTIFLLIALAQFWIGSGLRKLKPSSRIPTAVLSGIGLLGFPVGTLISSYIMYLVLSKKGRVVFSEEYTQVIAQTPHIKYKSIVVWVVLGILLLIIAIGVIAAVATKAAD